MADSADIVERLRALAAEHYEMLGDIHEPLGEAADEITRLRASLSAITDPASNTTSEVIRRAPYWRKVKP